MSSFTQNNKARAYLELAKAGIVTLVVISVAAGYLVGQPPEVPLNIARLVATVIGVLLLAAGSSALNQYQEIELDGRMARTRNRPLPSRRITLPQARLFIAIALLSGLGTLATLDLALAALGLLAVLLYNGLYTLWWKRHWAHAAVPGAVPGALPVLIGTCASSNAVFTPAGIYLFLLLFYWQMPHFWALAIRYREDYAQGGIPTLPVSHGEKRTTFEISLWCVGYVAISLLAPLFLPVGKLYALASLGLAGALLLELWRFTKTEERRGWLRFFLWINASLIVFLMTAAFEATV